jgi:hypothetical protein
VKNEKEQTEGNNSALSRKRRVFFKREREFSYALRLLFALQREREREKEKRRRRASPQRKAFKSFVVLPRFLPLDSFEYLFLKREEEEQSLGEERNSST